MCVKGGIESIKILRIQIVLRDTECLAEALIMHDLAFAKEFDGFAYIGIVYKAQNIVIGNTSFLLC